MIRSALLGLLLTPAIALAQTSRPAAEPAGKVIATALTKLRAAKLTQRLTQTQHFKLKAGASVVLVTRTGKADGQVLTLKVEMEVLAKKVSMAYEYEFGADGLLRKLRVTQTQLKGGAKRVDLLQGTISGQKLSATQTRNGAPEGKPYALPWGPNTVPAICLWFFVPTLFDQGLPARLTPDLLVEQQLRSGGGVPTANTFVRSAKPSKNAAGRLVHTFTGKGEKAPETTEVTVVADGPQRGALLAIKVGQSMKFEAISPKAYRRLKVDPRLARNEVWAMEALRKLEFAQKLHKARTGSFAKGLDLLEAEVENLAVRIELLQPTYLILMRSSPHTSKWIALAVPVKPGKTGKRYFVINQDGRMYASDSKLELDDTCAIPKGAKPLD